MAQRRCSQCGAEVSLAGERLSASCAFCDSPLVDGAAATEAIDAVVPFDVDRRRASELLQAWLARQWLAPEPLRRAARADDVSAVFVPFYGWDALARSRWSARVGVHWTRVETTTTMQNGKPVVRTRTVVETEWFPCSGTHAARWCNHLVSASRGLLEPEANALEPFDLGRALAWSEAAVAGVAAELPTVDHAAARATADAELRRRARDAVSAELLPGSTSADLDVATDITLDRVRLVLLPVWVAAVRGPRGPLRLLVNGQTGEVVGTAPKSWAKVGCAAIAIVLAAALALLFASACAGLLGIASS
jgi:hypothetical protein